MNTSEVIYTHVLTRPWLTDFHSELEKAAAAAGVKSLTQKRGLEMMGGRLGRRETAEEGVWTLCEPLN